MKNPLRSKRVPVILGVLVILLAISILVLRGQANSAASNYTPALQKYASTYEAKIKAVETANQAQIATYNAQASSLSPKEVDAVRIPLYKTLLAGYQPVTSDMEQYQPKLKSVPFGSQLSSSYKTAAKLQGDFQTESANIVSLGHAASQYYATYDALVAHLNSIGVIGSSIGAEETALTALASQVSDQNLAGEKDIRTQIADGRRSFKDYVATFKAEVKDLPLPDRYAFERSVMNATADRYLAYQNGYAKAYEDGDTAKIKQLAAEGRNKDGSTADKYNMIASATKPFSDPNKLKDPLGLYAQHFNALVAHVKQS